MNGNTEKSVAEKRDYSILDRHAAPLSQMSQVSNTGITVFDLYQRKHVSLCFATRPA